MVRRVPLLFLLFYLVLLGLKLESADEILEIFSLGRPFHHPQQPVHDEVACPGGSPVHVEGVPYFSIQSDAEVVAEVLIKCL